MMEIQNCKFHFVCPLHWNDLIETGASRTRYCETCGKAVYLVETLDELQELAERGECVAVSSKHNAENAVEESNIPELQMPQPPEENSVTMGIFLPPENVVSPPKTICPKCGAIYLTSDIKFCGRCGTMFGKIS